MNLKEIYGAIDRVTDALAEHDSKMQAMDYPGIPDSVWRELAAIQQAVYDHNDGVDPDRFRELNFEEYHYMPEYENDDEDERDSDDESEA